jgi:hypothetical protein
VKRALLWALVSAACARDPDPPPPPPPPPPPAATVELGRIQGSFVALEDGAELELVPGAQGGFHVDMSLRVSGFDRSRQVQVDRETRRDDTGDLVATTAFRSDIDEAGILTHEVPVFLCPAPVGISVADEPLEVRVEVSSDAIGEASVAFVPRCPSGDQADFCDQICRR